MSQLPYLLIIEICTLVLIVTCDRGAYLEGNRPSHSPQSDRNSPDFKNLTRSVVK